MDSDKVKANSPEICDILVGHVIASEQSERGNLRGNEEIASRRLVITLAVLFFQLFQEFFLVC